MSKFTERLPVIVKNRIIFPIYFSADDLPWLIQLMQCFTRFRGQSASEWQKYYAAGLNFKMPFKKGLFAAESIERELSAALSIPAEVNKAKLELFLLASGRIQVPTSETLPTPKELRQALIEKTLSKFPTLTLAQLELALLNGTGSPKIIGSIQSLGESSDLPRRLNGYLIRKLMLRALIIEVIVKDQTRRIVRQAKFRGLICEVRAKSDGAVQLRVSGPLAIFGPTLIYGRRLQEFIPLLFWNLEFKLRATILSNRQTHFLFLDSTSPLRVAQPPQLFDSKTEEQFFKEFTNATADWDLQREPEPICVGERMFFPDFLATNRKLNSSPVLIEIIGYWTKDYFKKKYEEIEILGRRKALFLINAKYATEFSDRLASASPTHRFVFHKRKIPINDIIAGLNELTLD
jgi:predicted nuclease of restriction endonuclease-like RecB superfamily